MQKDQEDIGTIYILHFVRPNKQRVHSVYWQYFADTHEFAVHCLAIGDDTVSLIREGASLTLAASYPGTERNLQLLATEAQRVHFCPLCHNTTKGQERE